MPPSKMHEVLVDMFRHRPGLAAELLAGLLGVSVPAFEQAHLSSSDLTNVAPTEYWADAVVTLTAKGRPVLAVVVEVQLRRVKRKRRTWPYYVVALHARLGCRVLLLVVCPDPAVARWCAAPVDVGGPGLVLAPLVLGPAEVPVGTDLAVARATPELAVFAAVTHGARPGHTEVFDVLLAALEDVEDGQATLYADFVLTVLPAAARDYLEALMTTTTHRYQSDFARRYYSQGEAEGEVKGEVKGEARGRAEGKAEGEARAVLAVLDARGIEVPDQVRERISGCTDLGQLDTWVRRAVTANKVDELFD